MENLIYIDHEKKPHEVITLMVNPDGTRDFALKGDESDKKRMAQGNGAEWWRVLDRKLHVPSYHDKVKAAAEAENEAARAEGRDADFAKIDEACLAECFAHRSNLRHDGEGGVDEIHLLASEADGLPQPYRHVVPEPATPADHDKAVAAGTVAEIKRTDIPAPASVDAPGVPMTPKIVADAKAADLKAAQESGTGQPAPAGELTPSENGDLTGTTI